MRVAQVLVVRSCAFLDTQSFLRVLEHFAFLGCFGVGAVGLMPLFRFKASNTPTGNDRARFSGRSIWVTVW